jgi:hypothetical protein
MATTESAIQTVVYQIDLGRGKTVLRWVVVVLVAATLGLVYTASQFRGLEKREAMDMAQLARNIARGEGFTTYLIRPLSLWQLAEAGRCIDPETKHPTLMQHPDLCNPPLYPLALAGLFKLTKPSRFQFDPQNDRIYTPERWVILPFDQVCLLLSLLLVYVWARQLFDQRVAVTAGLLLLFSDTLWSYAISGLPTSFLMLLLLLAMYCLFVADRQLNRPEIPKADQTEAGPAKAQPVHFARAGILVLASAVLLGLCFLTRYLCAFLIVPMVIYAVRIMRVRWAGLWAFVYALVFLAVITPWLVRNYQMSGSVLGVAKYQIVGDEALPRSYHPDLGGAYSIRSIVSRFLTRARGLLNDSLKQIGSDYFIFFFAVGLMYAFRRRDVARLRLVVLGALVCAIFGMALFEAPSEQNGPEIHGGNLLVLFLPLVAVYGVAFFYLLLDRIAFRIRLSRAAAIAVFALINLMPMIFTLLHPRRGLFPYPPYIAPYTRMVAQWFGPNDIGVSDLPWAMAWYGDRRTIWLPTTIRDFYEMHDFAPPKGASVSFLMLTPYMLNQPFQSELTKGQYKEWARIVLRQLPQDFPLKAVTPMPPDNDQILLADKARWAAQKSQESQEPQKTLASELQPETNLLLSPSAPPPSP